MSAVGSINVTKMEIERKYLVRADLWKPEGRGVEYRQGYISSVKDRIVRVRTAGAQASLAIKGINHGLSRLEFEYSIPFHDAIVLLNQFCEQHLVEKTRYHERINDQLWEIDVFRGLNEGLVLAEVELVTESDPVELPPWIGTEVSGDPRYFNSNLARNPYHNWRART
jgi:adenylate cyclase